MDTNKDKMMAFLSSMTEEQASTFMAMLSQQEAPVTTKPIEVTCAPSVAPFFAVIINEPWFHATIDMYPVAGGWSEWKFADLAKAKMAEFKIAEDSDTAGDAWVFLNRMLGLTGSKEDRCFIAEAVCEMLGMEYRHSYRVADKVSDVIAWAVDKTGISIQWVGNKVVLVGEWTQDRAPDAGGLVGKPLRWATDVVSNGKQNISNLKQAYNQVKDNKATE